MLHNIQKSLHTCKLTRIFAYVKSVKINIMKILNKELQKNLSEVCELIKLNACNENKRINFICQLGVHENFFSLTILKFEKDEAKLIDSFDFSEYDSDEKMQASINGIKKTLEL